MSKKKIHYVYRYRHITIGSGDTFIFKHTMILDKGRIKPNVHGYAELIEKTPNRDDAIRKTEALNIIEQLEEVEQ